MPRRGGRRRKRRTHVREDGEQLRSAQSGAKPLLEQLHYKSKVKENENTRKKTPKSFIVRHGKIGKNLQQLVLELRKIMLPNTAINLRERNKASMKDYVHIAPTFGVTHVLAISQSTRTPILKVARLPTGPTLCFRIEAYSLSTQVRNTRRKHFDATSTFKTAPLIILNNFEGNQEKRHVKITSLMFQAMFPPINVKTVKFIECRRAVLFNYDESKDITEMRHYAIKLDVGGVSKPIKRIIHKKIPNLGKAKDISETISGEFVHGYATSDSEAEDGNLVSIPNKTSRNRTTQFTQNTVKLIEIGPRMSLKLIKLQDGVFDGEVQYHAYLSRTSEEIEDLRRKHKEKAELKQKRKLEQEANVKRKAEEKQLKLQSKKLKVATTIST